MASPQDLLPPLPRPRDLQPFPQRQSLVSASLLLSFAQSFRKSVQIFTGGHTDTITGLCIEPTKGEHCATCSLDGTVVIWQICACIPLSYYFASNQYRHRALALGMLVHRIDVSSVLRNWHAAGVNDTTSHQQAPRVALHSIAWSARHCLLAVAV